MRPETLMLPSLAEQFYKHKVLETFPAAHLVCATDDLRAYPDHKKLGFHAVIIRPGYRTPYSTIPQAWENAYDYVRNWHAQALVRAVESL